MTDGAEAEKNGNMSGHLLVAHPSLRDSHFAKAVVLVSVHSPEEGTLGVILNHPLNMTLGRVNHHFAYSPLADIPIYRGGPVGNDQVILTAWQWSMDRRTFKFYFGIDQEKAQELLQVAPDAEVRGFLGYSGWSAGQLEGELNDNAWLTTTLQHNNLGWVEGEKLWQALLDEINPTLRFGLDGPENPSNN